LEDPPDLSASPPPPAADIYEIRALSEARREAAHVVSVPSPLDLTHERRNRPEGVRCRYSIGRFGSCLRGGAQVASVFPSLEVCLFWSLVYVVIRRVLELVVLFGRGERSKELEILVMRSQSRHSERTVRTKRSAIAFAFGARTGVRMISIPTLRKTVSKSHVYSRSRSRIRKRSGFARSVSFQAS
jgi:hypothetical protein